MIQGHVPEYVIKEIQEALKAEKQKKEIQEEYITNQAEPNKDLDPKTMDLDTLNTMAMPNLEDIELTEEDKNNFFKSIMDEEPYIETYSLFDGKMEVTFRTRQLHEDDTIIQTVSQKEFKTFAESEAAIAKCHLAYSLVRIKVNNKITNYDQGTLEERLKRLHMPTHKYAVILNKLHYFERKVAKLIEESSKKNS